MTESTWNRTITTDTHMPADKGNSKHCPWTPASRTSSGLPSGFRDENPDGSFRGSPDPHTRDAKEEETAGRGKHALPSPPVKTSKRRKTIRKTVRFTPDEWERARSVFALARTRAPRLTFQSWMLQLAINGHAATIHAINPVSLVREVRRIGVNVNQIARRVNQNPVTKEEAKEIRGELGDDMRRIRRLTDMFYQVWQQTIADNELEEREEMI